MKKKIFPLQTHFWTEVNHNCPYRLIQSIFSLTDLKYYKSEIENYFNYAYLNKAYKKQSASNVMYNSFQIYSLIRACYTIYIRPNAFYSLNLIKENFSKNDYYLSSLSKEKYADPYLTFSVIFSEITVEDLESVLSNTISNALWKYIDCVSVEEQKVQIVTYFRLLEACWLINERLKEKE